VFRYFRGRCKSGNQQNQDEGEQLKHANNNDMVSSAAVAIAASVVAID